MGVGESSQPQAQTALPPGNKPRYPLNREPRGLYSLSERFGEIIYTFHLS